MFTFAHTAVKLALMPLFLVIYVIAGAVYAMNRWWTDMVKWIGDDRTSRK